MFSKDEIEMIYERHVETVYRVCFMFMKNVPDTEDAVSTTFTKLMNHRGDFENTEHEKAWLIVTASNVCKNMLRHWWRKTTAIEESMIPSYRDHHDELLTQVLNLPAKYKTTIYLYYYEGYSSVEIARMLKKNESTIRSYLKNGRDLLRLSLGGEDR